MLMLKYIYGVIVVILVLISSIQIYSYQLSSKPFHESIYKSLLLDLLNGGYEIVLPRDFTYNASKKTVLIFHDCDWNMDGIRVFVEVEKKLGIRSAFFVRQNIEPFENHIDYLQFLQSDGFEVGYHYDVLSKYNNDTSKAITLFQANIKYLRTFFDIRSTRAHGDTYNLNIYNGILYKLNKNLWNDLGLRDFTYFDMNYTYIQDTEKNLVIPPKNTWLNLVIINFHSDWW